MNRKQLLEKLLPFKAQAEIEHAIGLLANSTDETISNADIGKISQYISEALDEATYSFEKSHPFSAIKDELSKANKQEAFLYSGKFNPEDLKGKSLIQKIGSKLSSLIEKNESFEFPKLVVAFVGIAIALGYLVSSNNTINHTVESQTLTVYGAYSLNGDYIADKCNISKGSQIFSTTTDGYYSVTNNNQHHISKNKDNKMACPDESFVIKRKYSDIQMIIRSDRKASTEEKSLADAIQKTKELVSKGS